MTTSSLVPGLLPCAIDGHEFLCDPDYERTTVQVMRQQSDTSTEAGEQSLSPQGLWRRSQESWHHGAGQPFLDGRQGDTTPDPHRFRTSKGIDPWTQGQISLLHPTLKVWSTSSTNLYLATAYVGTTGPPVLYVSDGNELYFNSLPYGGLNTLALGQGTGWAATHATIATASVTRFTLTATSAAAVSATSPTGTSGVPVDPGRDYLASVTSFYVSGGAGKTPEISITWYTAAGATISTFGPISGSVDTAGGGASTTATAPATARFASLTVSYTANWANGEIHRIHAVNIGPDDDVGVAGVPENWKSSVINAGDPVQPVQSIASNGTYVWAALGTSGLHRAVGIAETSTADVPAAPAGGQISLVGYANGFLLAAGSAGVTATLQNTLWQVTTPITGPALSLIKTHDNPSFVWTGISPGRSCVYVYGNSGANGEVYKIQFDPNTGVLATAASHATYLPDGETIHAVQFYAGSIIMGTGKGLRIGTADGTGNIDYGPLVPTDWPVKCIEPQDRYCWFGWTQYDTSNSGLGRVDLGFFTDTLTPAWASDLMTADTSTGDTVAVVTFAPYGYALTQRDPVRVFTVGGEGVYIEDPGARIPEGRLETGTIRFSTSEPKTTRSFDIRHHALPSGAIVGISQQLDTSGTYTSLGFSFTADSYGPAAPLDALDLSAEALEYLFILDRPGPAFLAWDETPEVTRWTAKVLATPSTIDETFSLKLHMKTTIQTSSADGAKRHLDVPTEIAYLKALERARTIVELQLGNETHEVFIVGSSFKGTGWDSPLRNFAEGFLNIVAQTVRG